MKTQAWDLVGERPGRFGLLYGPGSAPAAASLAEQAGGIATSVGGLLTADRDSWTAPELVLRGRRVLIDLDILFWPDVQVDPLRLLRVLGRHSPLIAVWPGEIAGRRATYSEPGRPDAYDQSLPGEAVVLRARSTTFPDELPYEVERI